MKFCINATDREHKTVQTFQGKFHGTDLLVLIYVSLKKKHDYFVNDADSAAYPPLIICKIVNFVCILNVLFYV